MLVIHIKYKALGTKRGAYYGMNVPLRFPVLEIGSPFSWYLEMKILEDIWGSTPKIGLIFIMNWWINGLYKVSHICYFWVILGLCRVKWPLAFVSRANPFHRRWLPGLEQARWAAKDGRRENMRNLGWWFLWLLPLATEKEEMFLFPCPQ